MLKRQRLQITYECTAWNLNKFLNGYWNTTSIDFFKNFGVFSFFVGVIASLIWITSYNLQLADLSIWERSICEMQYFSRAILLQWRLSQIKTTKLWLPRHFSHHFLNQGICLSPNLNYDNENHDLLANHKIEKVVEISAFCLHGCTKPSLKCPRGHRCLLNIREVGTENTGSTWPIRI